VAALKSQTKKFLRKKLKKTENGVPFFIYIIAKAFIYYKKFISLGAGLT
jgi:hypothetical protein